MVGIRICVFLRLSALLVAGVAGLLPEDQDSGTSSSPGTTLEEECAAGCPDIEPNQNRPNDSNSELGCGVRCQVDQCTKGCGAWQLALETNCPAVCNGTQEFLQPKQLYCVLGCHDALARYFQQLKEEIGIPPAPALVADSLTATSLQLEWKGIGIERRGGGLSYLVQWMYEELAETWHYCRNQTWGQDDQILVDNLQPYTKYRFRVALVLKSIQHNQESIVSAPSVPILTKPEGFPSSAPVIVRAAAVDSCRVSVSWEPGPFPNGPLLSYVLRLQGGNYSQLKDISASENATDHHYMFQNLKPNANYSVSITMRNSEGEGPPAVIYIATTPEPTVTATQQPILILGGEHTVKKQVADMLEDPVVIYETSNMIRGVAIHVASAQVFVSDSGGYVYRTTVTSRSKPIVVLSPDQVNFEPLSLSVDWLNLHLYVLGEVRHSTASWQIARCNLDGRGLTVAFASFLSKPSHIEVDPYNGYLFWVMKDGLYRLDLADISNGVKRETHPDLILEDAHLEAFMVDHRNFRLLVPHHDQNTVISVTLDGREVSNVRANTQQPKFQNVVSLAMANGLFYWTNGKDILTEDYHSGQNRYFHNFYPYKFDRSCFSVHVLMNASQPAPVPVNPPTGVQAVLGAHMAKVSWRAPYLLGGQGKGAWQNWSYELEIKDELTGEAFHQKEIAGSAHTVYHLRERSEYSIKAAAYTSAGRGPWSTEFRGRTLRDPRGGSYASILWSASEGLLKSDVTGENVETLIPNTSWKDSDMEYHIVDVAWYKDLLYLVSNNSFLYCYNTTSHEKNRLHINPVGSVAIDWISKKLYWANPKQQIITRANLDGTQQEPMSIIAIVKELMIDSLEAYLYWSTGYAVEVSRLNGQDRRFYYSDEIYNGKQVMGLTLDTENKYVYWIVRSYESGSILYRAPTSERIPLSHKIDPEKVSALQHSNMQGPLCYFSEHLLWLRDDRNAVIGDLSGQNTAVINGITLSGRQMVAVMDHTLHQYPKNLTSDTIVVLPSEVNVDSIRVEGNWSKFNVSWNPVKNINYGTVFYEVKFADHINTNSNPEITKETTIPYNNSERFSPYATLEVTIKAFTYWGMSHHSRRILRSPQAEPSQPTNARGFVEFQKKPLNDETDISAVFRWDTPDHLNGVILSYTIECWHIVIGISMSICDPVKHPPNKLEYRVDRLLANTTYYFRVQASTIVGGGWFTDIVNVSTEYEYPVPQILVAAPDAVKISDLDRGSDKTITRQIAIEVAYSAAENKVYWINDLQEMVVADIGSSNVTKILALNNTPSSLCVDWVTRTLFWTETDSTAGTAGSNIMRLDYAAWKAGYTNVRRIFSTDKQALNLEISPLTGTLYWIESTEFHRWVIMKSDINGENVQPFFSQSEECSCHSVMEVRPVMTVDNTDTRNPVIYWLSVEGNLHIADIDGCVCDLVINAGVDKGLPPVSLTVDKINVYWSNQDKDHVYYVGKNNPQDNGIKKFRLRSTRSLKAYGKSLQPYPTAKCLVFRQSDYKVELVKEYADSIRVRLPEPEPEYGCEKYNLPATLYTIRVTECAAHDIGICNAKAETRLEEKTYDNEFEARNLKPFTKYMFQLGLSNYYSDLESSRLDLGPGIILSTDAGVPTKPENVSVQALTPTLAAITWLPPKVLNGATVRYEIHWQSVQLVNGMRQKGEQLIKPSDSSKNGNLSAMLQPLLPGQNYYVYVRAYSANSTSNYNESIAQRVTMYPEPNNLTFIRASVNSMNLSWVPSSNPTVGYKLQYAVVGLDKWHTVSNPIIQSDKVEFRIPNLQPRTLYKFRFILRYPNYAEDFKWPPDARFTFQTLGDVPSAPGIPIVTKLRDSIYQVNWEPAQAHGSQVTLYRLEGKVIEDSNGMEENRNETTPWIVHYNGTDTSWIIPGEMNQMYQFRVQARNAYGFGAWSEASVVVDLVDSGILGPRQHLGLILGLSVPLILGLMLLCFGFYLCPVYRQRKEDKKTVIPPAMPDVELATLREIPRGLFQSNALYAPTIQNDPDDSALPKIKREQITLAKFLGSGAFGEVFQGNAKDLDGPGITGVAIKTLRKGASAQEKTEFLQEARLMSHFRHKHVLRLLGVCLDTDPPLLVLELMKAGDLLTYLRASRPLQPTDPGALRLQDLLAMCEDVARGCRYLEELHFVHRDLACRNCLVSARDRENRVVKIGDFGLARDIYKNDYYRKEGEGLLPVRWMAPESLVDGVFTSQSDVWAFGVLMWEITSLGQQPYPARTNLEVLYHVRAGGRLPKPLNCPTALHQLMLRCWSTADARPSFKACLDHIITLRSATEDATLSPVHAGHYLSKRGVSNMAYFADENQNHDQSGNSWKSSSSEGSRDMQPFLPDSCNTTALLSSGEIPKYLELLADNEVPEIRENPTGGYEVPRSVQILEMTGAQKEGKCSEASGPQSESTTLRQGQSEEAMNHKRESATSLHFLDQKGASVSSVEEKSTALDSLKLGNHISKSTTLRNSQISIDESKKCEKIVPEIRGSLTSLSGRSTSSHGSSASLTPSTRPSSSLINSQNTLPLKKSVVNKRNSFASDPSGGKNTVSKLHRTHSVLQNGKANIPLAINSALLNSLRQTPSANEDCGNDVATYTNINTDAVRVNG